MKFFNSLFIIIIIIIVIVIVIIIVVVVVIIIIVFLDMFHQWACGSFKCECVCEN